MSYYLLARRVNYLVNDDPQFVYGRELSDGNMIRYQKVDDSTLLLVTVIVCHVIAHA